MDSAKKSNNARPSNERRLFGAHVSVSGGFVNAIRNGTDLGANAIQVHPSPPQRWNFAAYAKDYEKDFVSEWENSEIDAVFFHAIYLINMASTDPAIAQKSVASLGYYLDLMQRIGGNGVIFHVGSMKDHSDEEQAFDIVASRLDEAIQRADGESKLLLEVAAGSGAVIGAKLEQLARIREKVKNKDRVAFALDTQHLWASGYNLQEQLEDLIDQVDKLFSLELVHAIHLNDSKTECGSKKDRHENLGEGLIGEEALRKVVSHPRLAHIPFILETPALKDMETAKGEVDRLRHWIGLS